MILYADLVKEDPDSTPNWYFNLMENPLFFHLTQAIMLLKYCILCVFIRMMIFRTEMLTIFIMYQNNMKVSEHEVHRDELRNFEKRVYRKYKKENCFIISLFGFGILCVAMSVIEGLSNGATTFDNLLLKLPIISRALPTAFISMLVRYYVHQ